MLILLWSEVLVWVKAVCLAECQDSILKERSLAIYVWASGLEVVKVAEVFWRKNHIIAESCRLLTLAVVPQHYGCTLVDASLDNLVPTDNATTVLREPLLYAVHKVALQLILIFQALCLDTCLTVRALLPTITRRLISADVDIL